MAKKLLCLAAALLLLCTLATGCGSSGKKTLEVTVYKQFFQGEDDSVRQSTQRCEVGKWSRVDIGGLSDLVITVTEVTEDAVTFRVSPGVFHVSGSADYPNTFTVKAGETLTIDDGGICDAASWYDFSICG